MLMLLMLLLQLLLLPLLLMMKVAPLLECKALQAHSLQLLSHRRPLRRTHLPRNRPHPALFCSTPRRSSLACSTPGRRHQRRACLRPNRHRAEHSAAEFELGVMQHRQRQQLLSRRCKGCCWRRRQVRWLRGGTTQREQRAQRRPNLCRLQPRCCRPNLCRPQAELLLGCCLLERQQRG